MLRALPLLVLYTICSERRLREELGYHLLDRWFVGWGMNEDRWDAPTFTNNRERFIDGEVARWFFAEVLAAADAESLVSAEHFSVDGTLVEAWASRKSVRPKQESAAAAPAPPPDEAGNPTGDCRGEKRSNATHASMTGPAAKLARKGRGKEAKLSYCGNALIENRHGLIVDTELPQPTARHARCRQGLRRARLRRRSADPQRHAARGAAHGPLRRQCA